MGGSSSSGMRRNESATRCAVLSLSLNPFHVFLFQMSLMVLESTPNRTASALLSRDFAPLRMLSAKLGASASISRAMPGVSTMRLRAISLHEWQAGDSRAQEKSS